MEIGVGTGRFASVLGIKTGIDLSKRMLVIARRRGIDVKVAPGERVPFLTASFDYAAIIITLCFAKNPKELLEEAYRVLRKNGRIIIAIVDSESFLGKAYQSKKSAFYKQARFLSVGDVTTMLKKTGFSGFSYYQTISVFPDKMNSVERPKKGFGKGGFVVISGVKR